LALSKYVADAIQVIKAAKYDIIILETSGIGQSDTEIMDHLMFIICYDTRIWSCNPIRKIDMLDFADLVALNKFDKRGALDAM
jgi:methylmalonyl-CoA mutase